MFNKISNEVKFEIDFWLKAIKSKNVILFPFRSTIGLLSERRIAKKIAMAKAKAKDEEEYFDILVRDNPEFKEIVEKLREIKRVVSKNPHYMEYLENLKKEENNPLVSKGVDIVKKLDF